MADTTNSFSYTITQLDYLYIKKLIRGYLTAGSYLSSVNNLSDLDDTNVALNNILPDQTGNGGKVLTTDGSNTSWLTTTAIYNDESAQDAIGTILLDSATIDFTYNDVTPSITATVIQAAIDHGSIGGLGDDDHTQYHTNSRALTWLGTRSTTDLPEGSNLYFTDERAQDAVGTILSAEFTYNDAGNAISINSVANTKITGLGTLSTQNGTFSGTSSGTNTGDQLVFKTISVSGQSDVVADSITDTLTLIAGTNVTLTTDATNDTITIAASGSSGISLSNAYAVSSLRI